MMRRPIRYPKVPQSFLKTQIWFASFYLNACLRSTADGILFVCPTVCPSVTRRALWQNEKPSTDILIPHERAITLVFWHIHIHTCNKIYSAQVEKIEREAPAAVCGRFPLLYIKFGPKSDPPLRQISAYNVSVVRASEKVQPSYHL